MKLDTLLHYAREGQKKDFFCKHGMHGRHDIQCEGETDGSWKIVVMQLSCWLYYFLVIAAPGL